ncbi:hypothetical protein rosag_46530 [Roseisolibacter agri]|uniref:Uncharacterized protein n=1 Tax=Roseisolibacter agri TaxID=2014610 RepID=A0AA37QKD5_9BACT|nr:hypothetical protein rosag_46530 [Roseisolibacter agri]
MGFPPGMLVVWGNFQPHWTCRKEVRGPGRMFPLTGRPLSVGDAGGTVRPVTAGRRVVTGP